MDQIKNPYYDLTNTRKMGSKIDLGKKMYLVSIDVAQLI